jgi:hypothetical protein
VNELEDGMAAGANEAVARGDHLPPPWRRHAADAVLRRELDDHRARGAAQVRDYKVEVLVVLELRFE